MLIKSICPHCRYINNVDMDILDYGTKRELVRCDVDEGGCDKLYLVTVKLECKARSYKIQDNGDEI